MNENKKSDKEKTHVSIGVSLGLCFGAGVGVILMPIFGGFSIAIGGGVGMLIGIIIGTNIKKK